MLCKLQPADESKTMTLQFGLQFGKGGHWKLLIFLVGATWFSHFSFKEYNLICHLFTMFFPTKVGVFMSVEFWEAQFTVLKFRRCNEKVRLNWQQYCRSFKERKEDPKLLHKTQSTLPQNTDLDTQNGCQLSLNTLLTNYLILIAQLKIF